MGFVYLFAFLRSPFVKADGGKDGTMAATFNPNQPSFRTSFAPHHQSLYTLPGLCYVAGAGDGAVAFAVDSTVAMIGIERMRFALCVCLCSRFIFFSAVAFCFLHTSCSFHPFSLAE